MIPEEYMPMVGKLLEQTKNSKLNWSTSSDSGKYTLYVGPSTIVVNSYESFPENDHILSLEILDPFGDKIDGFYISDSEDGYLTMNDLYSTVRRNALKIDATISDIMAFLNSNDNK